MKTLNKENQKQIKVYAINDMNQFNIPTYLLEAYNQRRKEDTIMNGNS